MLPFQVTFKSGTPVSEQILYAVKKAVVGGQMKAGDRFPSVRQISQELKINPNTAHKVVAALVQEGVLEVLPGIGTVVAAPAQSNPKDQTALLQEELERVAVEAKALGLSLDQVVESLKKHWNRLKREEKR